MNIDGARIGWQSEEDKEKGRPASKAKGHKGFEGKSFSMGDRSANDPRTTQSTQGRWPANLILDEAAGAALDEQSGVLKSGARSGGKHQRAEEDGWGMSGVGALTGSTGGASRFFYCAKASKSERNAGLDDRTPTNVNDGRETSIDNPYQRGDTLRSNIHPTVKPLALMRYLARLTATPTGGIVLDPFAGSGSTLCAAVAEGRPCIGIELDEEYAEIARARVAHHKGV